MDLLPVSGPFLPRSCGSSSAAAVPERPRQLRAVPGAAGTIQHGLIHWDELPGSVQHESIAVDRGFCSVQKA